MTEVRSQFSDLSFQKYFKSEFTLESSQIFIQADLIEDTKRLTVRTCLDSHIDCSIGLHVLQIIYIHS